MTKAFSWIGMLLLAFLLTGCAKRADVSDARTKFLELMPDHEVISVVLEENEAAAIEFKVLAKPKSAPADQPSTWHMLQYFVDDGEWKIWPVGELP